MGYDGAGGYTRSRNFSADASANIRILASAMDQEIDDIASAMEIPLLRDGQNSPTADIPMGGFRFINAGAAQSANDYLRAQQFIEGVPIYMIDTATSADRISVSSEFFTEVSPSSAPADGTRVTVKTGSHKSAPVFLLDGFSANVIEPGGARVGAVMASAGMYDLVYSSSDSGWLIKNPTNGRTQAEVDAGVTPTNYQYEPGIFERYGAVGDDATDDSTALANALLQAGQGGGSPAKAGRDSVVYYIAANTLVVPDNATLDISNAGIRTTNAAAITMGAESVIIANGENSTIESSGASGTAIAKTTTASQAPWYIYGFPYLFPTTAGQAGSVGLDFSAAYRGRFQIRCEDFETCIVGGEGTPTPQTYYNTVEARVNCQNGGTTGIKLLEGCNGTVLINPEVNGASNLTYFLDINAASGLVVEGGYLEGTNDVDATRGIRVTNGTNVLIDGTVVELATSANNNFALEVAGASTSNLTFMGVGFGGAWGSSAKLGTASGGGFFNFIGAAPTNMVCWLGASSFTASELNGTARVGALFTTGKVAGSVSAAADTAYVFANSGDGIGAEISNNSVTTTAARAALVINRVGGPGHVISFQNNGTASGGLVFGAGTPESAVTAGIGTLFVRTDGGASTTLYVKESGTGNTGWVAK